MNDTNMMPDVLQISKLAEYGSRQSDRWLFVFLLIIGLVGIWLLGRYITSLLADAKEDRKRYETNLLTLAREHQGVIRDLTVVLTKNTEALEQRRDQLEEHSMLLKELKLSLDDFRRTTGR
jgi:hypothetical protein